MWCQYSPPYVFLLNNRHIYITEFLYYRCPLVRFMLQPVLVYISAMVPWEQEAYLHADKEPTEGLRAPTLAPFICDRGPRPY